jgi:hypothetical protein
MNGSDSKAIRTWGGREERKELARKARRTADKDFEYLNCYCDGDGCAYCEEGVVEEQEQGEWDEEQGEWDEAAAMEDELRYGSGLTEPYEMEPEPYDSEYDEWVAQNAQEHNDEMKLERMRGN